MLEKILLKVQKPTRYTGGELNSAVKDPSKAECRFAFCFPDLYEVGMSHLGLKILYHLKNERDDTYCERAFMPWHDMQEQMHENGIPLFALESKSPLTDFDIVGFTLQYEMCYTNVLKMLALAEIPIYSKDRENDFPFICAGGPCAYNPEPMADFVDFFIIGEGEEINNEIIDEYIKWKHSGKPKRDYLLAISKLQGIYVPAFYDVSYSDGKIVSFAPNTEGVPKTIQKRLVRDMDKMYVPEKVIVPFMEVIHDRIMLELFRGCIRGCRFCQAGMIGRPVRERSPECLLHSADKLIKSTGYEEISLISLSTSDYSKLPEFTSELLELTEKRMINLALPSLRIDNFSMDLMKKIQKVRKSGLTFAPEAGTQRLRDVINKGITEEDILSSAELAFSGGYKSIKLYFMSGLPTETDEDLHAIFELSKKVLNTYYKLPHEKGEKSPSITSSVSCFVPKPFTPFQWSRQDSFAELAAKQKILKEEFSVSKKINLSYHESKLSVLEGVFARGDRRLSKVLENAVNLGCQFDAWNESFSFEKWEEAFRLSGISQDEYTRERGYNEILPWDMIDIGVTKEFLINENEKSKRAEVTPNCREKCSGCGASKLIGGACFE